jgi:RNA polymerase sigma factor (sigma-70 family)
MTEPARTQVPAESPVVGLLVPLRRYAASRLRDRHDVDDVVQETIERVLSARESLEPDTTLAYALVVARNVIATRARAARRDSRNATRIVDLREPDRPEDVVVAGEERRALEDALAVLPAEHRDQLLAHVLADVPVTELAAESGTTTGGTAAQLARTRARLRLEFVLALRRTELPTDRCRPVLLAVSAGDTRRQHRLRAGQHILHCPACSALSEPLLERRSALAGVVPWLGLGALGAWLRRLWQGSPRQVTVTAVTGTAVAAAVVGGTVLGGNGDPPPPPPAAAAPATAPASNPASDPAANPVPVPAGEVRLVAGDRRAIVPGPVTGLAALAGQRVTGRDVPVAAVVADEGFWAGDARGRVWVQLVTGGTESPVTVRPGLRVSFEGTITAHDRTFPASAGVSPAQGGTLLERQGAHIDVRTADLRVT